MASTKSNKYFLKYTGKSRLKKYIAIMFKTKFFIKYISEVVAGLVLFYSHSDE